MKTIELNKKVTSIEVQGDKIIINLEQEYIPEDGEYFYVKSKTGNEFLGIKKGGEYITSRYCSFNVHKPHINLEDSYITDDEWVKVIRPATAEEKELLDKVLEEKGKRWNPETKQIQEIPEIGDLCIFWGSLKKHAMCCKLEEIRQNENLRYISSIGAYLNCIPFQSVEHFKEFIKG